MTSKQTGILGEKIAENFLKKRGYKILDRNYAFRIKGGPQKGEIDIVAKKDKTIIFVEVKTTNHKKQRSLLFMIGNSEEESLREFQGERSEELSPESRVDFQKQKRIIKSAQSWLMKNKIPLDSPWQADVIAVEIDEATKKARIRHFKNAVFC